jgi:hypothetical protein
MAGTQRGQARDGLAPQQSNRNRLQKPPTEEGVNREPGIDELDGKKIVLRRGFRHLGALALNWNGTIIPRR